MTLHSFLCRQHGRLHLFDLLKIFLLANYPLALQKIHEGLGLDYFGYDDFSQINGLLGASFFAIRFPFKAKSFAEFYLWIFLNPVYIVTLL